VTRGEFEPRLKEGYSVDIVLVFTRRGAPIFRCLVVGFELIALPDFSLALT